MAMNLYEVCRETEFLDHGSPAVQRFIRQVALDGTEEPTEKAVRLYYAVRDGIRYDVYSADLSRRGLRASEIVRKGRGFCIHKSILYAAAVRAVGIPSRLVLTDVRNHIASDRLKELVGGEVFHYHCLTSIYLNGRWLKATPVFNKVLCRLYGIAPLEFDGRTDSLQHPYDEHGQKYMEFIRMHGEFDDFPYETVIHGLRKAHPRLFEGSCMFTSGSLVTEANAAKRNAAA